MNVSLLPLNPLLQSLKCILSSFKLFQLCVQSVEDRMTLHDMSHASLFDAFHAQLSRGWMSCCGYCRNHHLIGEPKWKLKIQATSFSVKIDFQLCKYSYENIEAFFNYFIFTAWHFLCVLICCCDYDCDYCTKWQKTQQQSDNTHIH